MDVNTEKRTNSTPIKNRKASNKKNTINGYVSEDTNSNATSDSIELFSDDENENDLIYYTPNVSKSIEASFLNISETSLLHSNKQILTPIEKTAVIPSTPLSLIPFITKINEQWTSDLETPQADKSDWKQTHVDSCLTTSESVEKSICSKQCTPNISNFKNVLNEPTSTSPVINCTRMRRRTKRRIFKTISITADTAIDPVNSENLIASNNQNNINKNDIVDMDTCDNKEKQNISPEANNMQDFFCNASFANIDQICANFANKNDTCNIENNDKLRYAEEISIKDNNTVEKENVDVDKNEWNEKKILHSDNKVTLGVSMDNIGFSTASGKHIYVSESAMSNAKSLLEMDDIVSSTSIQLENESNLHISNLKVKKKSSSSFVTAGGRSLNISDKALSKAKKMLIEQLEDVQINKNLTNEFNKSIETIEVSKNINTNLKKSPVEKTIVSNIGFTTAAGRKVDVSKEAMNKAQILLSDDINNTDRYNNFHNKSVNKRKSLHVCDGTLDKLSSNTKKVKLCNKNITVEKKNSSLYENTENTESVQTSNTFSNEIMASTAALLADERNNDQIMEWVSQVENCENKTPSSPVIGRQPVARKRGKKRNLQNSEKQEVILTVKSDINVNVDKEIVKPDDSCTKELLSIKEIDINPNIDLPNNNVTDILQRRLEAILEQEKIIKEKKLDRPKAIKGKLFSYKDENHNARLSWKKLVGDDVPKLCTHEELINRGISPEILTITSTTALSFKFRCIDFYGEKIIHNNSGSLEMEDGGYLIPDKDDYLGILEIKRSFLASPGVDPNLLSRDWIENHYKWIIWKLASMDRIKFNSINLPRSLTPANVMLQLKYRYDREIDRSQRSCLRRILEKDDSASKRMVLCVSSLNESKDEENIETSSKVLNINHWKMILTDGWYSIPAFIDTSMMNYIASGKIREGTKLMTFGAELLNLDQGCSPLEIPHDVSLKIHTNSTRKVRWDTKLGYTRCSGPMLIKLRNVCPNGGLIGKLKVLITRTYPMLYHEKNASGESIFRNSRCEEKANIAYEEQCRSKVEAFYAEAEQKFDSVRSDTFESDSIDLKLDKEKLLNHDCKIEEFKQELESKLRESMPPPRQVSSVLKVRANEDDTSAILTIWSPSEDIVDIFKEGTYISIHNIFASGKRAGDLQLTASRNTLFNKEGICKDIHQSRIYTPLWNIIDPSFNPLYGEFDTIGIVSSIVNSPYGMKNFDAVNIACPHDNTKDDDTSGSSYLSILFWQGVSTFGYTEILTIGSLIACSNLEWRRATSWNIPVAYCTDRSVFTRNPRHNHLCQAFEDIKNLLKIPYASYAVECAEDISLEIQKKTTSRTSLYITPDKNNSDKEPLNTNLSKSIGHNSRSDTGNSSSVRSAAIQRRLEKLHYYSNPPELSPIVLKNSSSRVSLDFRSPVRNDDLKPTKLNLDP
ncbi:breast cancer type 2 susceptibility protein homolog isoform X2 [Vespa mandarinia]|uniref:breast cancer type 2 susceptibility protein homolog isoform X2 n=1 Tax=Vespa mandarinia TaxID=7446 RepID=UPI001611E285|nr:breast cancer type 2 susceptibility protein homolog isoform X2 [Vespa mandarinia]